MVDEMPFTAKMRLARSHWADVAEGIHDKIADKIDARKTAQLGDVLERFERELVPHLVPLLEGVAANENIPAPIRELVGAIVAPEHFTQSLLIGVALGSVISPVLQAATAPFIQVLSNETWPTLPVMPLTPNELAAGVLKGVVTQGEANTEAALSGIDSTRMGQLTEIAGQAIGLAEALLLLRRDQITPEHFTEILKYSNLNPKFYDDAPKLKYVPPGAGEVIAGALKGHLPDPEARARLGVSGIDPADFDWLKATAGRPIGIEQAVHLFYRGKIPLERLTAIVQQSDVNDSFMPEVLLTGVYHPPVRTVVALIRQGAVTEARGRQLLAENGVEPADIDAYVAGAHHTSASTGRQITQAQVLRMYEAHFIDRPTATARLEALRYPADEITLLLDFADLSRVEGQQSRAVSAISARYVAHKVTKPDATARLGALGIGGAQATDYFAVWDVEREAFAPQLSVTQLQGALRRGLITHAIFVAQVEAYGYDANETEWLAGLAFPPPKAPKASASKDLTAAQLVKLYQASEITVAELTTRLEALGYDAKEAGEIIALA